MHACMCLFMYLCRYVTQIPKLCKHTVIQFSDNDVPHLALFLSFLRSTMMKMTHTTITIKAIISKVANTVTTILLSLLQLLALFAPSVGWTVNIVASNM